MKNKNTTGDEVTGFFTTKFTEIVPKKNQLFFTKIYPKNHKNWIKKIQKSAVSQIFEKMSVWEIYFRTLKFIISFLKLNEKITHYGVYMPDINVSFLIIFLCKIDFAVTITTN